ncbi:16S rRNA (cytosine(967)-C(5))-methyltransferase RsmB [Candidatus Zixiibacteriota bacterium]
MSDNKTSDKTTDGGNPRLVAAEIIRDVFADQGLFNELLSAHPDFPKLTPADRRLAYHLAAGTIKYKRRLDYIARHFLHEKLDKLPPNIRAVVRLGLFQLSVSEKIPPYAAVSETVNVARRLGHRGTTSLVNAVLRRFSDKKREVVFPAPGKDFKGFLAEWFSYPDWLIDLVMSMGSEEDAEQFCLWGNREPKFCVRINPLKADEGKLLAAARSEGIDLATIPRFPGYYQWIGAVGPSASSKILRRGLASVQNPAAGLVVRLLNPGPKDKITDLFAAPGGKTTAIAERQYDRGYVFAVDKSTRRLQSVVENKGRLGLKSILTLSGDATTLPEREVHRVLADVPCSALGTLPKNPDARWKKSPADIERLAGDQARYLAAAGRHVRKGGVLVYATCTITRRENQQVVEEFLAQHPHFTLEPAGEYVFGEFVDGDGFLNTFPPRSGLDCVFAARMRRTR